jgi:BirA family biotin operon repressor/biotin-[acetyl-CoA-carboxylase] ligase
MNFKLEIFDSLPSTNSFLLGESNLSGRAILALNQTAGQGRRGRQWLCPEGAVAMSLGFELDKEQKTTLAMLPFWLGIGLYDLVQKVLPNAEQLTLKWPNDLYFSDKKLAGILMQVRDAGDTAKVALGVGLNLNASPELPYVTSLNQLGATVMDPEEFAQALLFTLRQHDLTAVAQKWEARCRHLGKTVFFGDPETPQMDWQHGIALGLADTGCLRVKTGTGEQLLVAEELSLRV